MRTVAKCLWAIGLIGLSLGVSPLGQADPFGTSVKYPSIPCLIIAEVQVDGESASMHDTVGAFVGAELRGKAKVVYSEGKAYVALMVNIDGASNTVTLKVHVSETDAVLSATAGRSASLLVSAAGTVGSGASPVLIQALARGLVLSRDSMRLVVAPELLGTYKVQRSTDLIDWEKFPISGEDGETGLTVDPDQSHEFYRLIRR